MLQQSQTMFPRRTKSSPTRFEMANDRCVRQDISDNNELRDAKGIFEFDAKITHCTVDLRVPKQWLQRADVARLAINLHRLCAAK